MAMGAKSSATSRSYAKRSPKQERDFPLRSISTQPNTFTTQPARCDGVLSRHPINDDRNFNNYSWSRLHVFSATKRLARLRTGSSGPADAQRLAKRRQSQAFAVQPWPDLRKPLRVTTTTTTTTFRIWEKSSHKHFMDGRLVENF
jgi:hypothetical protein